MVIFISPILRMFLKDISFFDHHPMNSSIICNFEASSMLTAVVLKRVLRTNMNIVPASSSPSIENAISVKEYSSADLIAEYTRRYGITSGTTGDKWSSEVIAFVEHLIEEKGEAQTSSILAVCEAIVDGEIAARRSLFSTLFSGFPSHIFQGSLSMLSEQKV